MFASKAKQVSRLTENEDEGQILHFALLVVFALSFQARKTSCLFCFLQILLSDV